MSVLGRIPPRGLGRGRGRTPAAELSFHDVAQLLYLAEVGRIENAGTPRAMAYVLHLAGKHDPWITRVIAGVHTLVGRIATDSAELDARHLLAVFEVERLEAVRKASRPAETVLAPEMALEGLIETARIAAELEGEPDDLARIIARLEVLAPAYPFTAAEISGGVLTLGAIVEIFKARLTWKTARPLNPDDELNEEDDEPGEDATILERLRRLNAE